MDKTAPEEEAAGLDQRELTRKGACRRRANCNVCAREAEAKRQRREDLNVIEVRYSLMKGGRQFCCFDSVRGVELAMFFYIIAVIFVI